MTLALALLLWVQAEVRAWRAHRDLRMADERNGRLAGAADDVTRLVADYVVGAVVRLGEEDHPAVRRIGAALDRVHEEVRDGGHQ